MEISDLHNLCKLVFEVREKADLAKQEYSKLNTELEALEAKLLAALEENKLKNFQSEHGKVETRNRTSVKVPQGEGRDLFFSYLKERGIFDQLITVNSQTLNGWYKEELERATQEKKFLHIPGIDTPTTTVTLVLKRGK